MVPSPVGHTDHYLQCSFPDSTRNVVRNSLSGETNRLARDLYLSDLSSKSDCPVLCTDNIKAEHLLWSPIPLWPYLSQIRYKTFPSNLPSLHSSCYPDPQHQQTFPGNPRGMPAREASRSEKQVCEIQILTLPLLLKIQSPVFIRSSVADSVMASLQSVLPFPGD